MVGTGTERRPDEYGRVEQADDGRHVDAHQHLIVNVLQAQGAVLHIPVGDVVVQDQLHLQEAWKRSHGAQRTFTHARTNTHVHGYTSTHTHAY